jgi:hypothetical protein
MNTKKVWMRGLNAGGVKIPPSVRDRTTERIMQYADVRYGGRFSRLDIRYRGAFCLLMPT